MRTWTINYKRNAVLREYFSRATTDTRCMRNTANFYIRNTMTGLRKSPEERTKAETEVLHDVFTGIQKANLHSEERYAKKMDQLRQTGGMKSAVACSKMKRTVFAYPTREQWFLSYGTLDAIFKATGNPVYCRMDGQVNQNAIRKTEKAWVGYFHARKEYLAHPEKFQGKPKIPGYIRTTGSTAWWTIQTARLSFVHGKAYLRFVHCKEPLCIGKTSAFTGMTYIKTEVKPYHGQFCVMVTFDDHSKETPVPEHPSRILGVDVGLNNLLAVAGNFGKHPFLIKGRPVKAVNQWFNKHRAKLLSDRTRGLDSTRSEKNSHALDALSRKREDVLRDVFYKCAWYLLQYAKRHNVDVIVVGYNKEQKQEIEMGKANNQAFVSVTFEKLRQCIRVVAAKLQIPVVEQEESYTSKADITAGDTIPTYGEDDEKKVFSGTRTKRGLYRCHDGKLMNADVNGAANILRKRYPDAFAGQDLSYLQATTNVVEIRDWYVPGGKKRLHKKHHPSSVAKIRHSERKNRRRELLQVFGKSRKTWQKKAA